MGHFFIYLFIFLFLGSGPFVIQAVKGLDGRSGCKRLDHVIILIYHLRVSKLNEIEEIFQKCSEVCVKKSSTNQLY